jgi:hypothetical protein
MRINEIVTEAKKRKSKDPCWSGYEQIGMKDKNGKKVPNCVPKESVNEMDGDGAGRDGSNRRSHSTYGSRDKHESGKGPDVHLGPESILSRKKATKKMGDVLNKELVKSRKGAAEGSEADRIQQLWDRYERAEELFGKDDPRTKALADQIRGANDEFRVIGKQGFTKDVAEGDLVNRFRQSLNTQGFTDSPEERTSARQAANRRHQEYLDKRHADRMNAPANRFDSSDSYKDYEEFNRMRQLAGDADWERIYDMMRDRINRHQYKDQRDVDPEQLKKITDIKYTPIKEGMGGGVDAKGRTQQQWIQAVKAKFPQAQIIQSKMIDGPVQAKLADGRTLVWNKVEQGAAEGILEESYDGDEFYEAYGDLWYDEEQLNEAEYQGRKVQLGKPMRGDVKKFKVYVKDPSTGNIKKVNFGDPNMKIRKSNPKARKSFRARHNCDNPGPRTKARYWSCRKW